MLIRFGVVCIGLLFALPLVLGLSEEIQELVNMLHTTCVDETGTQEDYIEKAKNGEFVDDEKFKCYLMCVMSQMACIDEDGIVDVDATIAVIPEEYQELAAPIIRKCDTQKGSTPCENAWLTHKCYYNENPEVRFISGHTNSVDGNFYRQTL
nr:odorant binding protein 9 [Apriona germarii]